MVRFALLALLLVLFTTTAHAYSVQGNKILDKNGNPVLLRGVDRPSLEWSVTGESLSLGDYSLMSNNWYSNIVRLSLSQCFWLQNPSYVSLIAKQVSEITGLGMGVILDLHWSDKGGIVACDQQTMPDNNSVIFWTQVATAYANNPLVVFELYNEPHDVSWSVWRNGGDAGGFTTPGFQSLYNTVRAIANNLVIIGGLNFAYDLSGVATYAITGVNIAYCTHPYNYAGKQPSDWPTYFGYLTATYPVIATEFGNYDCTTSYYQSFLSYADQLGIHWTAWAWYPSGCGFPSIISDYTGTPSPQGVLIQASLNATNNKKPTQAPTSTPTPTPTHTSTPSPTHTSTPSPTPSPTHPSTPSPTHPSTPSPSPTHNSTPSPTSAPTTPKPTSAATSTPQPMGSVGTSGISVIVQANSGPYWLAVAFSNIAQTPTAVSFQDSSSSNAPWVSATPQQWATQVWIWQPTGVIFTPISIKISTATKTVILTDIVTAFTGGAVYPSSVQLS